MPGTSPRPVPIQPVAEVARPNFGKIFPSFKHTCFEKITSSGKTNCITKQDPTKAIMTSGMALSMHAPLPFILHSPVSPSALLFPLTPPSLRRRALQSAGSRRSRPSVWLAATSPGEASGPGSPPSGCTDPRRRCSGAEDLSSRSSTSSPPLTAPRTRGGRRELRVPCGKSPRGLQYGETSWAAFVFKRICLSRFCAHVWYCSLLCSGYAFLLLLLSYFTIHDEMFAAIHRGPSVYHLALSLIKTGISIAIIMKYKA